MSNSARQLTLQQRLQRLPPEQLQLARLQMEQERRRRVEAETEQAKAEAAETLQDFVPRISPRYLRPHHLVRLTDALERTETEPVRAIVNLPPRHSKTETILHAIARRLKRRPWETIAYITYGADLANSKSRQCRGYAQRAGVKLTTDALHEWRTTDGGGCLFNSIGGTLTGHGADVLIIDDPHKDRPEAESLVHREKVWNHYIGTALDRVEVGGSILVCQTRWHPDDLTGRLKKEHAQENWELIELAALGHWVNGQRVANDDGEALWPERWPKLELLKKKRDDYEWLSKFQQQPRGRGGSVFKDVHWYDPRTLPGGMRISIGIDLAYSEKTHAHHSAIVVLGQLGETVYVLHAQREQMEVPSFSEIIRGQAMLYPGVKVRWHTSTTEAGTAQLLKMLGVPVKHELARADKFIRAQPAAAAWNAGRVLLPGGFDAEGRRVESPLWVAPFVTEVTNFTGVGDREDDQVDAFGSAYSAWAKVHAGRVDTDDRGFSFG